MFMCIGTIMLDVILGWSYNICDLWFSTEREKKTISDWSEVCLLNAYPETLQHRPKITSEIIVPKDMNKSNELWQKCFIKTFLRSLYVFKLWEFSCYSYPNLNPVSNHQCTLCVINLVIVWIQIKILKKKLNHFRPQIFGNSLSEKLYKNICKFWIVDSYCNMYLWEFSCYSYPDLNSVSNHQCTLCVIHLVIERLLQNLKLSKPWLRSP